MGKVQVTFVNSDGVIKEIEAVRAIVIFEEADGKIQTVGECNYEFLDTLIEIDVIGQASDHAHRAQLAQKELAKRSERS